MSLPPFSSRSRGAHEQVDNDCPESARTGLLHLLYQLVEREHVDGWSEIARELQRIGRFKPGSYSSDASDVARACAAAEELLFGLPWEKVFDFCERLHSHLAQEVSNWDSDSEERVVVSSKADAQVYIANEIQRVFIEEHLAFEISDGLVRRRGRRNTADRVSRSELVLGDPRLTRARAHFNKALRYFRNVSNPDPENVVKEAVCAVEATARALFPSRGSTLGEVVKSLTGTDPGQLPKPIAQTFHGLYGFRSGGEGIGHGGGEGGAATAELAEYALAMAATQIVLLIDLANSQEGDVPF